MSKNKYNQSLRGVATPAVADPVVSAVAGPAVVEPVVTAVAVPATQDRPVVENAKPNRVSVTTVYGDMVDTITHVRYNKEPQVVEMNEWIGIQRDAGKLNVSEV